MPSPTDPDAPTVGGPSDPDVTELVGLIQTGEAVPLEDHLLVRGLERWLVVEGPREARRWALADTEQVRIDARTVDLLRQATCGGWILWIDGSTWVLVPVTDDDGVGKRAALMPALPSPGESA